MKKSYLGSAFLLPFFLMFFSITASAQYDVIVAKDGSGNFTTLQAAVNAAPAGQTVAYKIFVKKGKYREKVTMPSNKPFIYIIGESINETIISWDDYAGKAGVTEIATLTMNAADCALMNITIENSWGRANDGPQALALKANATRLIFKNCRFISGQDTVMANGNGNKQYFSNCYIDGNTDYIYGSAIAAFDSCVIFSRDRTDGSSGGYLTAANTPPGQTYGYVFRNCLLPDNNGNTNYTLGRPWGNDVQPNSSETKVVFLNCRMGKTIVPARWSPWSATTNTAVVTYAEYNTMYFNGNPVDLSGRVSWSQEFNSTQAAPYFVNSNLFGTWDPCAVLATACVPMSPILSLSNVRVNRNSSASTVKFNLCWPANGATLQLLRSTDSLNFTSTAAVVGTLNVITDTTVSYQFSDVLPPSGTSYFYKVKAAKTGFEDCTSDTMLKVNISIPLNGDFRSVGSGGWSNNVSSVATLTGGAVTAVAITSSPSGYTGVPTITFTAAPAGGTTATGTAIVTGGIVTGVNIVTPGSGYTAVPTLAFSTAGVGGISIWEKYASSTSSWAPVALGTLPSNANVTIVSGHTVKINTLSSVTNLTIQNGATLNSTGTAAGTGVTAPQTLRAGSGTAPVTTIIQNDGTFGSANGIGDGIILEAFTTCSSLTFTGTGTTALARFRPTAFNPNILNVVIDQNMSFGYNSVCFTGYYNTAVNQSGENCTITINAGRIVKLTHPSGGIHSGNALNTNPQGNVTYNINGILDLSATTVVQNFVPSTNAASTTSVTTMNISGSLILGTGGLNTVSSIVTNPATAKIIIKNGSVLDAGAANTLTTTTGTNGCFLVVEGSGALKRNVGAAARIFPIGTSATSYSPVTLTNSGTADNFTVGVKNSFGNPVPNPAKAVTRQWTITADNPATSNITASFGWQTADHGVDFSLAASLVAANYNGSAWIGTAATPASGTGTLADPYISTATGITAFGNFIVSNIEAVPVTLLSFNAGFENNLVKTQWTTTNEISLSSFKIERSIDGINFNIIGSVAAKNTAGNNSYVFIDPSIAAGIIYYRLKSVNMDGSYKYSKIISVNAKLKDKISVYPNPATTSITLTHLKAGAVALAEIFSADGKRMIVQNILPGNTQTAIDISTLSKGNYLLVYKDNGKASTLKFNKK